MNVMKIAVVMMIATAPVWAAEQRFPISLAGTIQSASGKQKITDQNLLSAPGNQLVLMINTTANVVAIEEWNSALTTQIDRVPVLSGTQALMENFRMAVVAGKSSMLMANLEMIDYDWARDGSDSYDGNLQLIAKLSTDAVSGDITNVKAQLIGVLNDPVNGIGAGQSKLFKGKLQSTGPGF